MVESNFNTGEIFRLLGQGIFMREVLEHALQFTHEEQKALFKLAREKRDMAFPDKTVEVRSVL
jgi:hypothetical protein